MALRMYKEKWLLGMAQAAEKLRCIHIITIFIAMAFATLLTLAVYAATACAAPANKQCPTATIDSGTIIGTTTVLPSSTATVNQYLGIPFAKKPTRFKPPEPVASWSSPYDASAYKPACIQKFNGSEDSSQHKMLVRFGNTPPPPAGESEDCLNLNVYAPAKASKGSKTVMVWIYGGGFNFGSNSVPLYDGSSFAANQDVVLVTINYRTNVFGFPQTLEIPNGQRNLGLLDQRLALDWVQRNIAELGGDPSKVTIFGESAGAASVDFLLTAPPDPLPFRAAILESGQSSYNIKGDDPLAWLKLAKVAGCLEIGTSVIECLREVPAMKLKKLVEENGISLGPAPDGGITVADDPSDARLNSTKKNSVIARVPILAGVNNDEARYVVQTNESSAFDYLKKNIPELESMGFIFDEPLQEVLDAYPIGSAGISSETDRLVVLLTEYLQSCPMSWLTQDSAAVGVDTWRYVYNASFANTEFFPDSRAYHGAEICMVFGTYPQKGATSFQREVSKVMQSTWARFAKDPTKGPGWKQLPEMGVFGGGVKVGTTSDKGKKPLSTTKASVVDKRCPAIKKAFGFNFT